ncbi:hypothetical protein LCGC14_1943180 [marine sediment metagenome]|uniref:Uncharacterized protein n=1 Tax=marine sediment metagenome TaxID=412755 RepID=A0A0F9HY03_9ZZZZ
MAERNEKDTSQLETEHISQEIDNMMLLAKNTRKPFARSWYNNNFFDDGFHLRTISRTTGRIIDRGRAATLYSPRRAIPKASRQIRGMANLMLSQDYVPQIRPEKVTNVNYPQAEEFQEAKQDAKLVAKRVGHWLTEEWNDQDLDIKMVQMVMLTMKNYISYIQISPDPIEEAIKTQVYDAFDIYLMSNRTSIYDSPFIIKEVSKLIRKIKANEMFDKEQLEKITPDTRYASDEIKEAYLTSKFGKSGAGSDSANSGTSRDDAFATVAKGLSRATADQDDVVLITPSSSTGRTSEASEINWNKRRTHLIGSTSPLMSSPRAGMSFGSSVATPSLTISTRSCIFKNITVAQFNDVENNVLVELTGSYNYYEGVHFQAFGNALTGDDAAAKGVHLSGSDENVFNRCTFGLDTVIRTAANYTLAFAAGTANSNNSFYGCNFVMIADADAPRHISTADGGGSALNRWAMFENCMFNCNADLNSGTTQTDVGSFDTIPDAGGTPIFKDCVQVGHTGWANTLTGMKILGAASNGTPLTSYGEAVNPTA